MSFSRRYFTGGWRNYIATRDGVRYLVMAGNEAVQPVLDSAVAELAVTQMRHASQCLAGDVFVLPSPASFEFPFSGAVQVDAYFVVKGAGSLIIPSPSIASVGNQ